MSFVNRSIFAAYITFVSFYVYAHKEMGVFCVKLLRVFLCKYQGSHRSGNSGKILKTFSSKGNQGKTRGFQPKSGKKISNQGTFFPNHFLTI